MFVLKHKLLYLFTFMVLCSKTYSKEDMKNHCAQNYLAKEKGHILIKAGCPYGIKTVGSTYKDGQHVKGKTCIF